MSIRPLALLAVSCALALVVAAMAFNSGYGIFLSLLVYSFTGTFVLVSTSLVSYWCFDLEEPMPSDATFRQV